jgi:hypothetical protein
MHTRIGPAGADRFDLVIGDSAQCLFQRRLDAIGRRLLLPAAVGRAIVLEADRDPNHARYSARLLARKRVHQPACLLLLRHRAFTQDLSQNAARTLRIAHIHIGPG